MRDRVDRSFASNRLRVAATTPAAVPDIDGCSAEISALKRQIECVARDGEVTVLVLGETGTGKERVARAIHCLSRRRRFPFVVVNCAGLSPTLIEDELFGHVRGAYTGAVAGRIGPFERANHGTILLDEVGDLPPELQLKLLRALQQRTLQRLGAGTEVAFDVQVIAATNVDLAAATADGRFREDLYYRLKVFEIQVPPLRRRGAKDLETLVSALLERFCQRRNRGRALLADSVWMRFVEHQWPGNVRELENTLERMLVAAGREELLTTAHLPADFGVRVTSPHAPWPATQMGRRAARPLPGATDLLQALERNDFRPGKTADDLGLSRHQIYRLMKRYAINSPADARSSALG